MALKSDYLSPHILNKQVFCSFAALTFMALLCLTGVLAHAESETDEIQYVNEAGADFTAILEPDPAPGNVIKDSNLVKVQVDGNDIGPLSFSDAGAGKVKVTGKLPDLEEGRHSATIETYHPDKTLKDRKQQLFIVDTTPPELELTLPVGAELPLSRAPFVVRYTDTGSGVRPSIKESVLEVTIADKQFNILMHSDEAGGGEIVLLPSSYYEPGTSILLSLKIADRAGNVATLNNSFLTKKKIDHKRLRLVTHGCPDVRFFYLSMPVRINLYVGIPKEQIFFSSELNKINFPIDFNTIGDCDRHNEHSNTDITKAIWEEISLTTTNQSLQLTKHDYIEGEDQDKVIFTLSRASASSVDSTLSLKYPRSIKIDGSSLDPCSYHGDANHCDLVVPRSSISFEFEKITIPVMYEQTFQPKLVINQQDQNIIATEKTEPGNVFDPSRSFFELNGEKYWFDSNNQATAPAVEGLNEFKASIVSSYGQWLVGEDKATLVIYKGRLPVAFAPPIIREFYYDRENQQLLASIDDEGTPLSELDITLMAMGFNGDFSLNPETGKLEARYPMPPGIRHAYLYVRDNANQLSKAQTIILGDPETDPENQPESDSLFSATETGEYVRFNAESFASDIEILSRDIDGTLRYRECYLIDDMFRRGYWDIDCSDMTDVEKLWERANLTIDWHGMTNTAKRSLCRRFVRSLPEYEYNPFWRDTQPVKICSDIMYADTKAPVISDISHNLNGNTVTITALIHDHGKPLSEIKTEFNVHGISARPGSNERAGSDRDLEFFKVKRSELNPGNGTYTGEFLLPAAGLEIFDITITARDKADNSGWARARLTIPRFPPEVELTVLEGSESSSFQTVNGQAVDVQLLGSARDKSGIDWYKTKCWIDHHFYSPPPKSLYSDYASSFQETQWESGIFSSSFTYGAKLMEGNHTARFQATDNVGLSAEVAHDFLINYFPSIRNFKAMPKAIQDIGGPAFTAMIFDRGKDIDSNDITFFIDNQPIDTDKLFYESTSAYFSVDGPLELPRGIHTARLTVIDKHDNEAEAVLRFAVGEKIELLDSLTEMRIDDITIWELMNQNGDGRANPGEYIRLFISLFNDSMVDYEKCLSQISPEDERIISETEGVFYYNVLHNNSAFSPQGFDLQIDEEILATTSSDPYEAHLNLEVYCGEEAWILPLILPIYLPSIPTDINSTVTVELDRLPYTTSEKEIQVRGTATSSLSFVEEVVIFINGQEFRPQYFDKSDGHFECTVPLQEGSNLIEVHALDQSGVLGVKTTIITCNSEVTVTLDRLPHSTSEANLSISGQAESSAGELERIELFVNGQLINTSWNRADGRFFATVTVSAGSNMIEVQATDTTGAIGRATARISFNNTIVVSLDALPSSTTQDTINVSGTVQSNIPVNGVTIRVNGNPYVANYNPGSKRFSSNIALDMGANAIEIEAIDQQGNRGTDSGFITRTVAFTPPSINITTPENGAFYQCTPVVISGTFDTGSSTLNSLTINTNFGFNGPPEVIGAGSFTADLGVFAFGGNFTITAILETSDGTTVSDIRTIVVGDCH